MNHQVDMPTQEPKSGNSYTLSTYKGVILDLLSQGHPNIELAASRLGISVRTFQRRLRYDNVNYTTLVDEVRYETACQMLIEQQLNIADIAKLLGFTDASNFSRAFRRWSGQSPGSYRQKQKHNKNSA